MQIIAVLALAAQAAAEPVWEALERAGNYGVPLALLALTGLPRSWRELFVRRDAAAHDSKRLTLVCSTLKWTTCALLFGRGALGAMTGTAALMTQYVSIGLPISATLLAGWFEIGLAAAIAARPPTSLLALAAVWKLSSEALWIVSGAPIWEFVERAGSYVAPLALAPLVVLEESSGEPS